MHAVAADRLRELVERGLIDLLRGCRGLGVSRSMSSSAGLRIGARRSRVGRLACGGNQRAQAAAQRRASFDHRASVGCCICHWMVSGADCRRRAAHEFVRERDVGFGAARARVVQDDGHAVARRFAEPDVARDDGGVDRLVRRRRGYSRSPAVPGWCGRRTSSAARLRSRARGLSAARTRSMVAMSSAIPSSAKYSPLSGISTESAATSAFKCQQPERRRRVDEDHVVLIAKRRRASDAAVVRDAASETSSISAPVRSRSAGIERQVIDARGDDERRAESLPVVP